MHVQNSASAPISLAVTSPSPGDGKSFVAANLALSFAEAGFRTILVDADSRRGTVHQIFDMHPVPGLCDYLRRNERMDAIIRQTQHDRLSLIGRGTQQRDTPELLTSPALPALATELRQRFDAVIFDTPPLAAAIDGYAIAAAARDVLLVLRIGKTERRMTAAKLELFDRLPVRVLGAVLNGIQLKGEFAYYRYYSEGYGAETAEEVTALTRV